MNKTYFILACTLRFLSDKPSHVTVCAYTVQINDSKYMLVMHAGVCVWFCVWHQVTGNGNAESHRHPCCGLVTAPYVA
uniref:Uncharacterized protein n=1 Tax=Arundo donax TaxID=35708 RepID=A0A0A9C115_ARUDO